MSDAAKRSWDLLLVVTSDRYGAERFPTVRRLVDLALDSGRSVQVWACNYANMLTECSTKTAPAADVCCAGDGAACCGVNPPVTTTAAGDHPAAARFIEDRLATHPERFSWVACSTCSADREPVEHLPGVLTEPSFANFRSYVDAAKKTVYVGGA